MDIKVSTEENIPKVEAKLPPIEIGRDGYTPYIQEGILEDGTIADTWWVNGEDTHKPSRGIKGEDGDTVDTSNFMKSDGSNYKEGMSLVTPVLLGTMIIVNKGVDSDSTAIADKTVEKGTVIKLTAHYKWEAKEGYTNPTGIYKNDADASSIYITSPIPECGENSEDTIVSITSTKYIKITLSAGKGGLYVSNGKVVRASGLQYTTDSNKFTFLDRIYGGLANEFDAAVFLDAEKSILTAAKEISYNSVQSTADAGYFFFAFPTSYGELNEVLVDGWSSIGGFSKSHITIPNNANTNIDYTLYKSNNAAFDNVPVKFKFK